MIEEATLEHPEVALSTLCELFGVSRSRGTTRSPGQPSGGPEREDVALRDAIERIVSEFPGYGYRGVSEALRGEGWTASTIRKCCV